MALALRGKAAMLSRGRWSLGGRSLSPCVRDACFILAVFA